MSEKKRFCEECGSELRAEDRACRECGAACKPPEDGAGPPPIEEKKPAAGEEAPPLDEKKPEASEEEPPPLEDAEESGKDEDPLNEAEPDEEEFFEEVAIGKAPGSKGALLSWIAFVVLGLSAMLGMLGMVLAGMIFVAGLGFGIVNFKRGRKAPAIAAVAGGAVLSIVALNAVPAITDRITGKAPSGDKKKATSGDVAAVEPVTPKAAAKGTPSAPAKPKPAAKGAKAAEPLWPKSEPAPKPATPAAPVASAPKVASNTPPATATTPLTPGKPIPAKPAVPKPASPSSTGRSPLLIEGKDFLPLRVLARPFSHIYALQDSGSAIVRENVPPFSSYYVYAKPHDRSPAGEGWYEVGSDRRGTILGWMRAGDTIEWKQTLCMEFEHPGGRSPVLLFKDGDYLSREFLNASPVARSKKANEVYEQIDKGEIPDDFPVLSMEPRRAVDIGERFYLMPILESKEIEIGGREGRLLKVAAATGAESGRGASTLSDSNYLEAATQGVKRDLGDLTIDVVYVMDLTLSMTSFVDRTRQLIDSISEGLAASSELRGRIRFGFWGFRDSTEVEGIEYVTHNYAPKMQTADEFAKTMRRVSVTSIDSVDYEEDVFAGVLAAINETAWTPGALKFIILVGDAPGHVLGHKWNSSGMDPVTLRQLANKERISIFSLHLLDSKFPQFYALGEEQFSILARNRGQAGAAAYHSLNARGLDSFESSSRGFFQPLQAALIESLGSGGPATAWDQGKGTDGAAFEKTRKISAAMVDAALVDWLGKKEQVDAPRDVTAWVTDKDLKDPSVQSLKVNVLLTKAQLDDMNSTLKATLTAGLKGQISGKGFFSELQSVAATAAVNPEAIKNAKRFADTGLVPEFLFGLPYKSEVMNLTPELWGSWSEDRQQKFLLTVESKIEYYRTIHDKPEKWIALAEGADEDAKVAPIPLALLP